MAKNTALAYKAQKATRQRQEISYDNRMAMLSGMVNVQRYHVVDGRNGRIITRNVTMEQACRRWHIETVVLKPV